ncbi:MAG TPA: hypothetical protein VG095_06055, partial [Chthoniobacterales bacterium]|nr:hypothetical protein [Chthoniobacterales bacterium]
GTNTRDGSSREPLWLRRASERGAEKHVAAGPVLVLNGCMLVRMPGLDTEQITEWIHDSIQSLPPAKTATARGTMAHDESRFDFNKVREALHRARTKTWVPLAKPLRRLRRNQGAVNDSLIDAVSALLEVNKQMAAELAALRMEMAELRAQVPPPAEN